MPTRNAVLLLLQVLLSYSKTLDNSLIDTPTVSCGPESLTISAESSDIFEGQVFIKSHRSASPDCLALFSQEMNTTKPSFSLPLARISSCGLEMKRDNEAKSLRMSAVIVFAFHPHFVTAGDRAFAVHCLFQQKDVHVETQFDSIHDIHPIELRGVSLGLPRVEMSIVHGRNDSGLTAHEVSVGSPLLLVWRLVEPSPVYGIRVLDCMAADSDGDGEPILTDGCAHDPQLLSHVRYSSVDDAAFSEVTAFKMPDEAQLFFRCRVSFCIRRSAHFTVVDPSAEHRFCQPSICDEPRPRRSTEGEAVVIVGRGVTVSESLPLVAEETTVPSTVCLSDGIFALSASVSATVYTAAVATAAVLLFRGWKRKRSYSV